MDVAVLLERVQDASLPATERLAAGGRLGCWLQAVMLGLQGEVAATGGLVEAQLQDATRLSARSVQREVARVGVVEHLPALGEALGSGDVSVDHVDVLGRALAKLALEQRAALLDDEEQLLVSARMSTPERFERALNEQVRALLTEADREAILERQRCNTRLRTWVDRATGMWNVRGEFDPETGVRLQLALDARHDQLFATAVPATAPDDPLERASHLRALAFADLALAGGGTPRPEVLVTLRPHLVTAASEADWRLPIEVPRAVLHQLVTDPATLITPIVVHGDLVLHAPGALNLGRTTRLASRAQRRALQAIHPTCVADGCETPFDRCHIHHVIAWENGGPTDLANLQPVCTRDHTRTHQGLIDLPPPTHRAA
jgi:hypothetical protein